MDSRPGIPHLSEKEKEEFQAAGKCFVCKETGHMSRNCPKWNTIRSNNQRLPGAFTFNIELDPAPHKSDIDDLVKVLDSLPVGSIDFKIKEQHNSIPMLLYPLTEWRKHYPYWNKPNIYPCQSIGDCYVMQADAINTRAALSRQWTV